MPGGSKLSVKKGYSDARLYLDPMESFKGYLLAQLEIPPSLEALGGLDESMESADVNDFLCF
jgi:hypothetical protein